MSGMSGYRDSIDTTLGVSRYVTLKTVTVFLSGSARSVAASDARQPARSPDLALDS